MDDFRLHIECLIFVSFIHVADKFERCVIRYIEIGRNNVRFVSFTKKNEEKKKQKRIITIIQAV